MRLHCGRSAHLPTVPLLRARTRTVVLTYCVDEVTDSPRRRRIVLAVVDPDDVDAIAPTAKRLNERGIHFALRRQNNSDDGPWQLFCFDPNGARVELDFDAREAAPA